MTEGDDLYVLVGQAFELRGTPYLVDAVAAILDWHDRRHLRRYEQRRTVDELVALLRRTDPKRTR